MNQCVFSHQVCFEKYHLIISYTITGPFAARILDEDLTVKSGNNKFSIKKGSTVLIAISAIHTNKKYWKNAQVFDPDRFSPQNKSGFHTFQFLPFGIGMFSFHYFNIDIV